MEPISLRIDSELGAFSGLHWPNPGAPQMLCLHGWLDNAASFLPLAEHLNSVDLVALDMAGHGYSQHRPEGARYYLMDYLWDLDAVLDALGWDQCILMGHSLGGVVASLYAATAPNRVNQLITLDGLGPLSAGPDETIRRLRDALKSSRRKPTKPRLFSSIEQAAQKRTDASGLPFELSTILVERALSPVEGGFQWHTDRALNWHSPALLHEAQVLEILSAINAPTLAVTSEPLSRWVTSEMVEGRLAVMQNLVDKRIRGHHHFHMDQPQCVADMILSFLSNSE